MFSTDLIELCSFLLPYFSFGNIPSFYAFPIIQTSLRSLLRKTNSYYIRRIDCSFSTSYITVLFIISLLCHRHKKYPWFFSMSILVAWSFLSHLSWATVMFFLLQLVIRIKNKLDFKFAFLLCLFLFQSGFSEQFTLNFQLL